MKVLIVGAVFLLMVAIASSEFGAPSASDTSSVSDLKVNQNTNPAKVDLEYETSVQTEQTTSSSESEVFIPEREPLPIYTPPPQKCHPSYSGCLDPHASDYDCAGGSGNGPKYTGKVQVLGPDVFGLDRDRDGWGCE